MISEYVCVPQRCCHYCVVVAAGALFLCLQGFYRLSSRVSSSVCCRSAHSARVFSAWSTMFR